MQLDKLKSLLGIALEDTTKDAALQFAIDDTQEVILNYCHLEGLPAGLSNTAYRMAMDMYRNEGPGDASAPLGPVSSITEGDTTTAFRARADEGIKDSLLKNYKTQLNRYRRLTW
jgi:hypothetical protein